MYDMDIISATREWYVKSRTEITYAESRKHAQAARPPRPPVAVAVEVPRELQEEWADLRGVGGKMLIVHLPRP